VERDERDLADALDQQWDALLRGDVPAVPADVDADLVALVAGLQAAGSALPPLFPDVEQAWRDLRANLTPRMVEQSDEATVFPTWFHANGHAKRFTEEQWTPPLPRRRRGDFLNQLATAALLLLTLAVGFVAIGQRVPENPDEGTWVPALVRALESGPDGVVDTPLVETTFSAEELPGGDKEAVYYQLTIPPGESLSYLGGLYCGCRSETITKGVGVEVVQTGTYTIRFEAPLRVQRAGSAGPDEEIPAGTEVTLAAGDAVIYPDYAAPGTIGSAGDGPVTLTGVVINATESSGTPLPKLPTGVRATLLTYSTGSDWDQLPPGPLNVTLRQVTLPPGSHIGPYTSVGLQAMRIESGTVLRNLLPAGEATPRGRPLAQRPGTTTPFMAPAPGLRRTLDVDGDQPTELLVLIIEPAAISTQSLAP
jgi:hypothetical protein